MFPDAAGQYVRVLLPLLDLVNHRGEGANAHVSKDEATGDYSLVAARDIRCHVLLMQASTWWQGVLGLPRGETQHLLRPHNLLGMELDNVDCMIAGRARR